MEVNKELTAKYHGLRCRRPGDKKWVVISHVLQTEMVNGRTYLEAFCNVVEPEAATTGHCKVSLDSLISREVL